MEEFFDQSANTAEVAVPQIEDVQVQSENTPEVAETAPVQDAETNAYYAEQRRQREYEEYKAKAEQLEQQAQTVDAEISRMYGDRGIHTWAEYQQAIEEQKKADYYAELGIDPETLNKAIEEHPDIQYARELRQKEEENSRFNQEADELFSEFPELKPDQIQPEVWTLKEQRPGLSLLDAYLRVNFKSLGQQKEQEAIQKLSQNAQSTPGALGAGAEHKVGYSNLSAADKKALRERVLRGESIEF